MCPKIGIEYSDFARYHGVTGADMTSIDALFTLNQTKTDGIRILNAYSTGNQI